MKKNITSCLNWGITLGWLGFALYLWFGSGISKPDQLNGVGDFLAGMFAPVAFFWLVRGYYQQGEELKQNTEALRLQADELKNSVEQQAEQVRLTAEQLVWMKQRETLEIDKIIESVKPKFYIWIQSHSNNDGYELNIQNYGAKVTDVTVNYSHGKCINSPLKLFDHLYIAKVTIKDQISLNIPDSFLKVNYINQLGYQGEIKFMISKDESRIHNIGFSAINE